MGFRDMVGIEYLGDGMHFSGGLWALRFIGMLGIELPAMDNV